MTEYDIEGFRAWLSRRYTQETVGKYVKPLEVAVERGIIWDELKVLDVESLWEMVRGCAKGNRRRGSTGCYKSGVTSYAQYLEIKERGE